MLRSGDGAGRRSDALRADGGTSLGGATELRDDFLCDLVGLDELHVVFGLWWAYFKRPAHEGLRALRRSAFIWGYGQFVVFGSAAAFGAGLQVAAETTQHASAVRWERPSR